MATTSSGKLRVIYLITTKTPSRGLTPESLQTNLIAFDPANPQPIVQKPFTPQLTEQEASGGWNLYTASGLFAITKALGPDYQSLAFYDPDTLEQRSHVETGADPNSFILGLNYDGYAFRTLNRVEGGFAGSDMHFYNGHDGSEIGLFRNVRWSIAVDHGFLLDHEPSAKQASPDDRQPGVFYFDMRTKAVTGPIAPYLEANGHNALTPSLAQANIYGDTLMLTGDNYDEGKFLKLFDMATNKELFSLDATKMEGLKISEAYLGGSFIYLKNASDNPVVDYRTSKTVSSGWSLRPLAKLDGGWVLLNAEGPTNSGSLCVGSNYFPCGGRGAQAMNTSGAFLARGPNGDYDGPWY